MSAHFARTALCRFATMMTLAIVFAGLAASTAPAAPIEINLRIGSGEDVPTVTTATPQIALDITGLTADPDTTPKFECWVDSDAPVACTNPWTMRPLANGIHTAYIKTQIVLGKPPFSLTQDVVGRTTFRVDNPVGPPAIKLSLKVPKSARAAKSIKLAVSCPDACTLTPTLKIGGKKVKGLRSVKLGPGASTVNLKLPAKAARQVKAARKRNRRVKVTLGLQLKGKDDTVKNSIRNMK